MGMTGQQFTIAAGEHEATVVEVGGGLRRYTLGGADVTRGYDADVLPPKCCGGVLVPWPNRLRGGRYNFDGTAAQLPLSEPVAHNAIHGLARWDRWRAIAQDGASVTLGLDIVPQTGWPFEVSVEITYTLDASAGLRVDTTARNTGSSRAPFGAGFHPYLSCGTHPLDEVTLRLPADTRLLVDEVQIPIGSQPVEGTPYDLRAGRTLHTLRMDDCFSGLRTKDGRGTAELTLPGGGGARVWFGAEFGYLQAFTLDAFPGSVGTGGGGTGSGAALALEPMTCAPDAFNSGAGLLVLEPGEHWTGSWGITPLSP